LLVLDNCEHLVEEAAGLVERLLEAGPGLRILATSREALRVPGERARQTPPIATPEPPEELDAPTLANSTESACLSTEPGPRPATGTSESTS
jgi:predicted ATPase